MQFDDIIRSLMASQHEEVGCDLCYAKPGTYAVEQLDSRQERRNLGQRIPGIRDVVGCGDSDRAAVLGPEYVRKYPEITGPHSRAILVEIVEDVTLFKDPQVDIEVSRYLVFR
ncbi:hypothetical protein GF351_00630 [Candidatus Woesearchaeota archaeon]|nr:hypothetical protein [Candidatus Woesearchaeota archaeon]